ncbi:PLD nuclease N-terminal domain-containing protein [Virgibacillus sp.]|uniref:PLD nuclease N-terminal domain-containing protein n=1 Tax=Virgibacillus sp. TaxID=1872700 RepID=UPI00183B54E7|nr:PLD nuclease N-terminal domain-containing protein [Virgibacillus sp.]NWO13138.1 PLDc_N domain-containing protein [Virgibacillus sp.]
MEDILHSINWAILAPIIIIQLILVIVALIDWAKVKNTNGPKWLWLIIIIFLNMIGPILYFLFGRRHQ